MKFTAQTTTTNPIDAAITTRLGARPAEVSTYTESGQPLFAHGELLDAILPRRKSNPRSRRYANGSLRRHGHFRLDDVLMPVTPARGHVAWQNEVRQRGKRYVVRTTDARLQHPPAPHRNAVRHAKIMNLLGYRVPAHAPHLYVDDLARPQPDRRLGMLQRVNALVQANRRLQLPLQLHVRVQIIPTERLLDHHQVIPVKLLQHRPIRSAISGIGIHHQLDARKILPHPFYLLHVLARLDFDFDPLIPSGQLALHRRGQLVQRLFNSNRYAASNLFAYPAQQFRQRNALLLGLSIPEGCFQSGFGHVVPAHGLEHVPNFCRLAKILSLHQGPKMIAQNVPSRLGCFRAVPRRLSRHALAPSGHPIDIRLHQNDAPLVRAHRAGFERRDQLHPQLSQRDLSNSHSREALSPLSDLKIAPRRQQIRGALLPCPDRDRSVLTREPSRELLAHSRLHRLHPLRVFLLPLLESRRQLNRRGGLRQRWRQVLDCGYHARRVQPPLRHQPIRNNSSMQWAGRNSVQVRNIPPANSSQPIQIEMRVLQLQRIKRPLH